jgi:hypothetical protein
MEQTTRTPGPTPPPVLKLSQPDDVIEAVPYLVGFYPHDSLVLIGLGPGNTGDRKRGLKTVVTVVARLDLADVHRSPEPVHSAALALSGARSSKTLALIYVSDIELAPEHLGVIEPVEAECADFDVAVSYWLFVAPNGWAMGRHAGPEPLEHANAEPTDDGWGEVGEHEARGGFEVSGPFEHAGGSLISATATYAGMVARPDRAAVAELLAPESAQSRDALLPALQRAVRDRQECSTKIRNQRRRSDIRSLFTATRALPMIDSGQTVRFGAALSDVEVRDACWLAIEAGRIDGEQLWRELSRVLPDPYRAPALFLFGWGQWRSGAGAIAGIAVDAALACDPTYHAAELLDGALAHGLDPFRTPRLRKGA